MIRTEINKIENRKSTENQWEKSWLFGGKNQQI